MKKNNTLYVGRCTILSVTCPKTPGINFLYPIILEFECWRQPALTPHTHSHHCDVNVEPDGFPVLTVNPIIFLNEIFLKRIEILNNG